MNIYIDVPAVFLYMNIYGYVGNLNIQRHLYYHIRQSQAN